MALTLRLPDRSTLDLGNPLKVWTAWAELAILMGDQDQDFPQLLYVPFTDDAKIPKDIWSQMQAQATLALERYGAMMSEDLRWYLNRIVAGRDAADEA